MPKSSRKTYQHQPGINPQLSRSPGAERRSRPQAQSPLIPQHPSDSVAVYDAYDLTRPPQHPGRGWTRFVCVSDTHALCFPVPQGDVLLHAGDLTAHGTLEDLETTLDWMKRLPHHTKLYVLRVINHIRHNIDCGYSFMAGNHDVGTTPCPSRALLKFASASGLLGP